ncbi:PH domain-containing protein [Gordonia aichiensis]
MDNRADLSTGEWSTPRPAAAALLVGGLLLVVLGVIAASDPAGMVLMCLAGALLLAFGAYALMIRPRLAVGPGPALTIRTLGGSRTYPHDRIDRIRVLRIRRIGRRSGQLEIDVIPNDAPPRSPSDPALRVDTKLHVFGRWDLGTDPRAVADALRAAGFEVDDGHEGTR